MDIRENDKDLVMYKLNSWLFSQKDTNVDQIQLQIKLCFIVYIYGDATKNLRLS